VEPCTNLQSFMYIMNVLMVIFNNIEIFQSFVGHGDSVNEIRTQSLKPSLVVSASKVLNKSLYIFTLLKLCISLKESNISCTSR
jgi:hypothetical protein